MLLYASVTPSLPAFSTDPSNKPDLNPILYLFTIYSAVVKNKQKPKKGAISPRSLGSSGSGSDQSAPGSARGSAHSSGKSSTHDNQQRYDQQCQTSDREQRRNLRTQNRTSVNKRQAGRAASPQSDDECNCDADRRPKFRYQGELLLCKNNNLWWHIIPGTNYMYMARV